MMAMLRTFWTDRSVREQRLLGVMFALLVPVILWFGVIAPLTGAMASAQARLDKAVLDHGIVAARAGTLREAMRARPAVLNENLVTQVGAAGQAAGFTLDRLDAPSVDHVELTIASAKSAALFGWLHIVSQKGIIVERITLRPNSDATLNVQATLRTRR
jgi:general secretion pathway protein M